MSLTTSPTSLRSVLDQANPTPLASALQALGLGQLVRQDMKCTIWKTNPDGSAVDPYVKATMNGTSLPDDAKACSVLRAYARAGGVTGDLAPVARDTDPSTGQISVSANGDIVTLEADEITSLDVVYMPERCDVFEMTLPVASNSMALPAQFTGPGVVLLMEAESLAGTLTGKLVVLPAASSNSTSGAACLDVAMTHVLFDSADAVTSARVKIGVASAIDPNLLLEAASPTL